MKKLTLGISLSALIIIILIAVGIYTSTIKLPIHSVIHAQYATDLSNNRKLVGASHNIFVGKVLKKTGETKKYEDLPATLFEVSVISNIKGNVDGNVIVEQEAGYEHGVFYSVEDDKLLTLGSTYLFATRSATNGGPFFLMTHPNAKKLLSSNSSLSREELQKIIQKDEKVEALQKAYKHEILPKADILHHNIRNSYQATHQKKIEK